ncbi:MAG: sigma-70 factor domain-containing protein [Desulfobacterales bacterium]
MIAHILSQKMHTDQAQKFFKANIRGRLSYGDVVLDEATDPVKLYLREMGGVTLLCREDETQTAKEIEAGEQEVLHALLKTETGADYLIKLGAEIEKGKIRLRHVIRDIDEGDDSPEEKAQTEKF